MDAPGNPRNPQETPLQAYELLLKNPFEGILVVVIALVLQQLREIQGILRVGSPR